MNTSISPVPEISALLTERIAAGDFPSAVYAIAVRGRIVFADALGDAVRRPVQHPARLDTIYDLASLTKPLATGLLCARRIERGELRLDDLAIRYLPEFEQGDKRKITLQQLLTHTSGFPAWRPLYLALGSNRARILETVAYEPLVSEPGTQVEYSDFNFVTLGVLLERITGVHLDVLTHREIVAPLGLTSTAFNPPPEWLPRVAATEEGNEYERHTIGAEARKISWREHVLWGEVHDGNAHFLGGVAGHAGLFADARDTVRLAAQFLAGLSEMLKPETCALFRRNFTPGQDEARSFAWALAATKDSTAGPDLPPDAFGHLGFTGTSCWNDPHHERTYVLLTNRTHARALPFVNINSVRRRFHTLAHQALNRLG